VKEIMTTREAPISFSSETPDEKIAPVVVAGAIFVGKAVAGAAVAWGTTRALDKAFPSKK
jgi:hypothetical protein